MQRDCPTYPLTDWGGAGYQVRCLDDLVRRQFGCLAAVDPVPKEKGGKKEEKKSRCSPNTLSGFRFVDPSLADDDDDDDEDDTDAEHSDENNNMGAGSFVGARVEKATISSSAKVSTCEKRRPDNISYSAAIRTCDMRSAPQL